MKTKIILIVITLLPSGMLAACGGSSQAAIEATATQITLNILSTQIAANIFATQTASVPTDTPTLTATATPTVTDTPTPTSTSTSTLTPTPIPPPTATPQPTATPIHTPTPVTLSTTLIPTSPTPTPTPTTAPRICHPAAALVEVNNTAAEEVTFPLQGPENVVMVVPGGAVNYYCLVPGQYGHPAPARDNNTYTLVTDFRHELDECICLEWHHGPVLHYIGPCTSCPADLTLYIAPPLMPGAEAWSPVEAAAHCPNPGVCIIHPAPDTTISGQVSVLGTANIENFQNYKLEWWGEGGSGWNYLLERFEPVIDDELLMLDTRTVPAGMYGLRLTVIDQTGNYLDPFEIWWRVEHK